MSRRIPSRGSVFGMALALAYGGVYTHAGAQPVEGPESESMDDSGSDLDDEVPPSPEARGPDWSSAEQAFRQGSDLYEMGRYPESIEQFTRAWELSKEVQLLYNLGQAHWKWFDIDPDIEHLRQAALFFRNYDKRMRLVETYDSVEIDNILTAIDAQIVIEEQKAAERRRPLLVQPNGPTEKELIWQRRRRTTRGLNIAGTTIMVAGGVTLLAGLASWLTRVGYGLVLDNTTVADGGFNLATGEQDAQRRSSYLQSGEVAFGTLIGGAVVLPIGVALRVIGAVRERKDRTYARELDQQREKNAQQTTISLTPAPGGLRLRF